MGIVYFCPDCNRMVSNINTVKCTKCGHKYVSLGVDSQKWKSLSAEQRRRIVDRLTAGDYKLTSSTTSTGTRYSKTEDEYKGKAIASLVLGIVSIFTWLIPLLGFPTTIIGLIMGIKSAKSKDYAAMAIVGIILSSICLLLTIYSAVVGAIAGAIAGYYLDLLY